MNHPARPGFQVERVAFQAPVQTQSSTPLRFAQVSDLHMCVFRDRHRRRVDLVNAEEVDFVFVTGDFVSRTSGGWPALARVIGGLRARHGVFACRGNWEFRDSVRADTLRDRFREWGAELLINESRLVRTPFGAVHVGAVDDVGGGWPDFDRATRDAQGAQFGLVLCHAPRGGVFLLGRPGVHLVLSGHTHAGQIGVPGLSRVFLPDYSGEFIRGMHRVNGGRLYVNRGFGSALAAPLRFLCPPEVTLFTVRPAPATGENSQEPA
jgi:predicted MPP superfamily phosphohydrolase